MNNAFLNEDKEVEASVLSREKVEILTETIEALQNVLGSSYWKVLQQNVFDVESLKSKRRLEREDDTTEIFRLQGEIRISKRYDLEEQLTKCRKELSALRK